MVLNVFVSSGGGARVGASFGAEYAGERQGKFSPNMFDFFLGTSAGALDAALTANGWTAEQKINLFMDVDFASFFTMPFIPYAARKALALAAPMSLNKLAGFLDSLEKQNPYGPPLKPVSNLLVNSVRADKANKQVVFCEKKPDWLIPTDRMEVIEGAFSQLGYGKILTRSMSLPGLVADAPMWFDGGIAENPLFSVLPADSNILLLHLGYAGLVGEGEQAVPNGLLNRALYCYERKAFEAAEHLIGHYPKCKVIKPEIYDVDSTAFNLSHDAKWDMIQRAMVNSAKYW